MGGLLAIFTLIHFIVDWGFQSHKEAMAKHNHAWVRARHCLIYTLGFLPILFFLHATPLIILASTQILFWSHFFEDTYFPVFLWVKYVRRPPQMAWKFKQWFDKPYLDDGAGREIYKSVSTSSLPWREKLLMEEVLTDNISLKEANKRLDRGGFLEFVTEPLGKILMIVMDQIIHLSFLIPILWMIVRIYF